jgi:GntR family transcriptional repressor for pyruvate dehydrogenase complex
LIGQANKENTMDVGHIRQRRLSDTIVEQLETMILEGALTPGERLPAERSLAEQFGVSRPSLREAIQKLIAKGLLTSRQGGGNYVSKNLGSSFSDPLLPLLETHPEAHHDLLEFRHTLEADCAYYAALRATEVDRNHLEAAYTELMASYSNSSETGRTRQAAADARFHLAIAEASHNVVLLHTMRGLFNLLESSVLANIDGMQVVKEQTRQALMNQHRDLFAAIMQANTSEARHIAGNHIRYVQDVLAQSQEEQARVDRALRRESL